MTEKPQVLAFGPAPRPSRRLSQAEADQLSAGTADLGFGRATSTPATEVTPDPDIRPLTATTAGLEVKAMDAPKPAPAPRPRTSPGSARPKPAMVTGAASLKFDVPPDLWTELKVEAAQRRVTVKYVVLEALSKQGFSIDLEAIPEDGRRLR